ncbi:hypothetical protein [Bacteriovorax sp. Seq25_V]|uniref:hypothetical protein n=1 Tax=Bacteriovorax sp. Seq25_V TaxID=1201288 RepID=UPI00038A3784|nr:hypothetical protein [Bacteriovorax sp. Seq25_V]EQC43229.1 hypothetical protein M900_0012 [Bacteriovorax sp. Seq25_V]
MNKVILLALIANIIFASSGGRGNTLGDDDRIVDLRDKNTQILGSGSSGDTTPDSYVSIKKQLKIGEVLKIGHDDILILRTMKRYVALDKYQDVELYREIKDYINIEAKKIKNIFGDNADEIIKEDLDVDQIKPYILEDF